MKKLVAIFVSMFAVTFLSGCVQRLTDFTFITSKNVEVARFPELIRADNRVEGEDMRIAIIFPLGIPNAKEALDNAIHSTPGCVALADGVLEQEFFYLYFGYFKYRVKGTCLIDPKFLTKTENMTGSIKSVPKTEEKTDLTVVQ